MAVMAISPRSIGRGLKARFQKGAETTMIALDEEMVGSDTDGAIVQEMKVCLAFFVKTNNGGIVGVHFTPTSPLNEMNTLMAQVRVMAPNIVWMGMVTKFSKWGDATSGLVTKEKLAAYFRTQARFDGEVTCADVEWGAVSYDIKCTAGITPRLEYRATPQPINKSSKPNGNVYKLMGPPWVLSSTGGTNALAFHMVPANTGGFATLTDLKTVS
jgi:hypothetical protein